MTNITNASLLNEADEFCHVIPDFLDLRSKQFPEKIAYCQYNRKTETWDKLSYSELKRKVVMWQKALAAMNLEKGSHVAILLNNSIDAVLIDQAVLANGLVTVPLHAIDTPKSSAFIISDSDSCVFITNKLDRWTSISRSGIEMGALHTVIFTDETDVHEEGSPKLLSLGDWLEQGKSVTELPEGPKPEDLANIVYTSGTTGKPKGVMLTHRNVARNVVNTLRNIQPLPGPDFNFLSFLPLSHTFERTVGYYLPLAMGNTVWFNRSIALLMDDLKYVKPEMFISVPRIYELVCQKINDSMRKVSPTTRFLFNACVEVGWRNHCRRNNLPVPSSLFSFLDGITGPFLHKLIAPKILAAFGGRLQIGIAGGAALNFSVAKTLLGLGMTLVQGYGMTEHAPVITVNNLYANNPKTVGSAIRGTELRLDPETNELQARGESVMKGYWKRPDETAKIIRDGWLCTGDVADINDQGHVTIRGRIKEIIVTSTGEKIPPVDLEHAIESDHLFAQACVLGENRPFITFLAVLNPDEWKEIAEHFHVDPKDPNAYKTPVVRAALVRRAKAAASGFPHYALPRSIVVATEPWSIDNGMMTPTMKLKRKPLYERYEKEIDEMYALHA